MYEWGNPNGNYCQIPDATAYYRWRCKLNYTPAENITEGAFSEWKVLLLINKKDSFARVIKAGFGEIVECR